MWVSFLRLWESVVNEVNESSTSFEYMLRYGVLNERCVCATVHTFPILNGTIVFTCFSSVINKNTVPTDHQTRCEFPCSILIKQKPKSSIWVRLLAWFQIWLGLSRLGTTRSNELFAYEESSYYLQQGLPANYNYIISVTVNRKQNQAIELLTLI